MAEPSVALGARMARAVEISARLLPATAAQLDLIEKLCRETNSWTPEPSNRGQASQMISGLIKAKREARSANP